MKQKITIALSGNPNAGKTTVFNAITGARQHIANYPGVTVEKKIGKVLHRDVEIQVVDLPGTYSLTAYSLEEIVARDFLVDERPDLVVDIVDASNLDRNLYLAVQFRELGTPLIIALNMVDVSEARGITVDAQGLSRLMGVPVVPMVARSRKGIQDLLDRVVDVAGKGPEWKPLAISYGMDIDTSLTEIEGIINRSGICDPKYPSRWLALKCLEGDSQINGLLQRDPGAGREILAICERTSKHLMDTLEEEPEGVIADHRYGYITGITKKVVRRKIDARLNLSDKIDKVLTNRIIGPLFMFVVLYGIYAFTFWGSETPVAWFGAFFERLKEAVSWLLPQGYLRSMIVSGVIDGVGGVLGFVPLIMCMFFAIAIMEDSGYMARVAYMLDRVLRWFGLHGNSVMALIVSGGISGGCAVPGVLATRTLRNPKERIATLLVVPFMNCGAKLPVYAVLIGAFFAQHRARFMFFLTVLSWMLALFAAKLIRSTVLRGPNTPFVMELPPYRMPTLQGLIIHAWERTWQYVKKAGTVILAFSILLWAMMTFPGLSEEQTNAFEARRAEIAAAFLALPDVKALVKSIAELRELDGRYDMQSGAAREGSPYRGIEAGQGPIPMLAEAAFTLARGERFPEEMNRELRAPAEAYIRYRRELNMIRMGERQAALKQTVAGRIGLGLEAVTRPLGFDYRTNIALIGGFAAKEVVVSTLGTAYSLGEIDAQTSGSLSERLRSDPDWNPLIAFTLIVFTMLYVPCFVTVISIRRESSWAWAGFSIGFNLVVAYAAALMIQGLGVVFGLRG